MIVGYFDFINSLPNVPTLSQLGFVRLATSAACVMPSCLKWLVLNQWEDKPWLRPSEHLVHIFLFQPLPRAKPAIPHTFISAQPQWACWNALNKHVNINKSMAALFLALSAAWHYALWCVILCLDFSIVTPRHAWLTWHTVNTNSRKIAYILSHLHSQQIHPFPRQPDSKARCDIIFQKLLTWVRKNRMKCRCRCWKCSVGYRNYEVGHSFQQYSFAVSFLKVQSRISTQLLNLGRDKKCLCDTYIQQACMS